MNRIICLAKEAINHLRSDADFNRSWVDGRKQFDPNGNQVNDIDGYEKTRKEVADQRDSWADAIEKLIADCERQH